MELNPQSELMLILGKLERAVEGNSLRQDHTNEHLRQLNGSVAKHADKLASMDILHAQTTMSQQQIIEELKAMKTETMENKSTWKTYGEKIFFSVVIPGIGFLIILGLTRTGILNL